MSTLRTRIYGHAFEIRTLADGSKEGAFVGTVDTLPYELRSTYAQAQGQAYPILIAAVSAVIAPELVDWCDHAHQAFSPAFGGGFICLSCGLEL